MRAVCRRDRLRPRRLGGGGEGAQAARERLAVGGEAAAVNDSGLPAVVSPGTPVIRNWLAAAEETTMPVWDPMIAEWATSVTVIDWTPAVLRMAENDPTPLDRDCPLAGSPLPAWAEE